MVGLHIAQLRAMYIPVVTLVQAVHMYTFKLNTLYVLVPVASLPLHIIFACKLSQLSMRRGFCTMVLSF